MKPLQKIIAENIKKLRINARLSEEKLGLLMGYKEENAQSRIQQYERWPKKGARSPGKKTLDKMATIFNVTANYFYIDHKKEYSLTEEAMAFVEELMQYGPEIIQKCRVMCKLMFGQMPINTLNIPLTPTDTERRTFDRRRN